MSGNKRVKVVGYSQEVKHQGGISHRNFSDALVGNQLTSDSGTTLFTLGNFRVTTNLDPKKDKMYRTSQFSKFYTSDRLGVDEDLSNILNAKTLTLNLDRSDIRNYAYFGSFREYIRVALEHIITMWPASIYVQPIHAPSYENNVYNEITDTTTFDVHQANIKNDFGVNIKEGGSLSKTFNEDNKLRDLNGSFNHYNLAIGDDLFQIIDYVGYGGDGYLHFKVKGNPFQDQGLIPYHIKPTQEKINLFFLGLNDFESHLLSRDTNFKAEFNYNYVSDSGTTILGKKTVQWPVSDGYNIDFKSSEYMQYVGELLKIAEASDSSKSNIISNRMVSESIFEWDTVDQKMGKTLKIYGRNFDDIKRYGQGIKFANTVTYDKKNNTPDSLIKNLARTLGWELTTSLFNIDLNQDFLTSNGDLNLSPVQSEIEFWRRLIINSPWVWKSKGTRKVVEFLLKFVGTPEGLVTFNEYVYKATNTVDVEELKVIFALNNIEYVDEYVPVDENGYPRVLRSNGNMYFQKGGLWYKQTAGEDSNMDILTGNNPHIGPYDGGYEFINQFNSLVPNFEYTTITNEKKFTKVDQTFVNYDLGKFDKVLNTTTATFIEVSDRYNNPVADCFIVNNEIIQNPKPNPKYNEEGNLVESLDTPASFKIYISRKNNSYENPCEYSSFLLDGNGLILFTHSDGTQNYNVASECCTNLGYTSDLDAIGRTVCRWKEVASNPCDNFQMMSSADNNGYILFTNLTTGEITNLVPTADCCTTENLIHVENGGVFSCKKPVEATEPTCDDYIFTGNFAANEQAIFQYQGGTTTSVMSTECCTANNLEAKNINGGVYCVEPAPVCETYTIAKISKGYVVFTDTSGMLISNVADAECCSYHGFEAELQTDGSVKCHEPIVQQPLPILTLISRNADGECSTMDMKIEGTPNTVVKYRITTKLSTDHGFFNMVTTENGTNVTPALPLPTVGSYCEGSIQIGSTGVVYLDMQTCARPALRADNCVGLEFAIFDYDNENIKDTNRLINGACSKLDILN